MLETLRESFQALQADGTGYPAGVLMWMRVMAGSFLAGVVFVRWWRESLWIVLLFPVTFTLLVLGKTLAPTLSRALIGSVVHLVIWPLALYAVWSPGVRARRRDNPAGGIWRGVFLGWLVWVSIVILVSLVLDARYLLVHFADARI